MRVTLIADYMQVCTKDETRLLVSAARTTPCGIELPAHPCRVQPRESDVRRKKEERFGEEGRSEVRKGQTGVDSRHTPGAIIHLVRLARWIDDGCD